MPLGARRNFSWWGSTACIDKYFSTFSAQMRFFVVSRHFRLNLRVFLANHLPFEWPSRSCESTGYWEYLSVCRKYHIHHLPLIIRVYNSKQLIKSGYYKRNKCFEAGAQNSPGLPWQRGPVFSHCYIACVCSIHEWHFACCLNYINGCGHPHNTYTHPATWSR